jgi:hypothetical protein
MTVPTLLSAIVEALRSAGATEEIIAAAVKAGGESVGNLGMPHRAREAGGASMAMTRRASALIDGVTKFETKFPCTPRRVTKFVTKIRLPPARVTKFVTKFRSSVRRTAARRSAPKPGDGSA